MNRKLIIKYINYRLSAFTEHDLHSPFLYDLYMNIIKNKYVFYDFEWLNGIRAKLMSSNDVIEINDLGAGSKKLSKSREVKKIVKHGNACKKQAEFLYRLVNKFKPQTIVELGTSIGLTTLYLAKASSKAQVYTIEGCSNTYSYANEIFEQSGMKNITSIQGNFDVEFPKLINQLSSIDLLYIDGNHTYDATIRYFEAALTIINSNTIIVFDDINWSDGMQKAWKEICDNPKVKISLDFFHFGMVFFRTEHIAQEHFVLKF
jgi:predicted O-methyltransferase YrrM